MRSTYGKSSSAEPSIRLDLAVELGLLFIRCNLAAPTSGTCRPRALGDMNSGLIVEAKKPQARLKALREPRARAGRSLALEMIGAMWMDTRHSLRLVGL